MKVPSIEAIARALSAANVRYLVAGGVAVNAPGYLRMTNDLDIVIQLDSDNPARGGARSRISAIALQSR